MFFQRPTSILRDQVKPGNGTVPKGEDVTIDAILSGFDPERADINLRFRTVPTGETSSMQVVPGKEPLSISIFNIQDAVTTTYLPAAAVPMSYAEGGRPSEAGKTGLHLSFPSVYRPGDRKKRMRST